MDKNVEFLELSLKEAKEINGGDGFAEDVGYFIGFSIKWNLKAMAIGASSYWESIS